VTFSEMNWNGEKSALLKRSTEALAPAGLK
jgi:hypothetical protein